MALLNKTNFGPSKNTFAEYKSSYSIFRRFWSTPVRLFSWKSNTVGRLILLIEQIIIYHNMRPPPPPNELKNELHLNTSSHLETKWIHALADHALQVMEKHLIYLTFLLFLILLSTNLPGFVKKRPSALYWFNPKNIFM